MTTPLIWLAPLHGITSYTFRNTLCRHFGGIDCFMAPFLPAQPAGKYRQKVWQLLCRIPFGTVTTYGAIAAEIAHAEGRGTMSAQAVGGAVGHNPVSLIVPCHRVIGSDGSLTGYAGGTDRKRWLLKHEQMILRSLGAVR